jgi:hypothetical protein
VIQLATLNNFTSLAYGCAYESDRKYLLFSPSNPSDQLATQEYVYNWITTAWTLWTRPSSASIVNQAVNKLYVADNDGNVYEERKTLSNVDYADQQFAITISSIDTATDTFTLVDSSDLLTGDVIQQTVSGEQMSTQVTGNNIAANQVTVDDVTGFIAGSAEAYRSISTLIQYTPLTCGFAQNIKKFMNYKFAFSNANFEDITVSFTSDMYTIPETATLTPLNTGGWGSEPGGWGSVPWGVAGAPEQLLACNPSLNTSYARWVIIQMSLTEAFTSLSLDGITASFDVVSVRGR